MEVRRLLKEQLLRRFLELSGNIYPDLVRVFYTNLQFNGDILVSHVKGVHLEITNEVWTAMTGLKYSVLKINRGNTGVDDEFNKMQFYKNCLQNPQARVTKFGVGGLKLNESLVAFVVSWILTPRGNCSRWLTRVIFMRGLSSRARAPSFCFVCEYLKRIEQRGALVAVCSPTIKLASEKHQR